MKKLIWIAIACAGALAAQQQDHVVVSGAVAGQGAGTVAHFSGFAAPTVKGLPYSAEAVTENVQTLPDGNRITSKQTSKLARDGEGRTRMEHDVKAIGPWVASGEPITIVMIDDPVAKEHITLHSKTKTAEKFPLPSGEGGNVFFFNKQAAAPAVATAGYPVEISMERVVVGTADDSPSNVKKDIVVSAATTSHAMVVKPDVNVRTGGSPVWIAKQSNVKKDSLGKQMMEGVEVEGSREVMTIPAGEIGNERAIEVVTERWYSPALQIDILRKHTDPRFGENTYKVTNLQRSEPSRSLFEIPPDYKVENPIVETKVLKK